jgi:hypothetical protein
MGERPGGPVVELAGIDGDPGPLRFLAAPDHEGHLVAGQAFTLLDPAYAALFQVRQAALDGLAHLGRAGCLAFGLGRAGIGCDGHA